MSSRAIVPFDREQAIVRAEDARVVINPPQELQTSTGYQLGWDVSANLARLIPGLNQSEIGTGITQRIFAVSINTALPLLSSDLGGNYTYLENLGPHHRAYAGMVINGVGAGTHAYQALNQNQFGAHAVIAIKYLFRGGLDAALWGINNTYPLEAMYLLGGEAVALLVLGPERVSSVANTIFRLADRGIDNLAGGISNLSSRLFGFQQPVARLSITSAQVEQLRRINGDASLVLEQRGNNLAIQGVEDRSPADESRLARRPVAPPIGPRGVLVEESESEEELGRPVAAPPREPRGGLVEESESEEESRRLEVLDGLREDGLRESAERESVVGRRSSATSASGGTKRKRATTPRASSANGSAPGAAKKRRTKKK